MIVRSTAALALTLTLLSAPAYAETPDVFHTPARTFSGAFLAAAAARNDNDFGVAARYYDEALRFDPSNDGLKQELMVSLLTDGQFENALIYARDLQSSLAAERVARLAVGVDLIRSGQFDEAQTALLIANQNDLERLLSAIMRGWAGAGLGSAEAAIDAIVDLSGPSWFDIFQTYHAALIAEAGGNIARAKSLFEDGMNDTAGSRASPLTYIRMASAYATLLAAEGATTEAQAVLERGLALAPTNPLLLAGATAIAEGETLTREAMSPAQGTAEILLNLGSAINREGAEAFAALYLEMARAAWPEEPQVLFELGSTAERLDQVEKAIEYYADVASASPLHRLAALQQGLALSDLDRNDEAKATLTALIDESPEDFRGYMALGGVHSFLKEWAEAASIYEKALENIDADDPRYWTVHYRLGISYERQKLWEQAEPAFLKALELSPDQPDVLNYLGYSWIDMNMNLERGLEMIETAVRQRPRDGYIVDSLGWAHYRLGNFEDAVIELEKATNLRPRDPTINDHLGDAYWRVGRKLEAVHHWSRVLDMESEDVDFDKVRAKVDAANSSDMNPDIASSIVDDQASGVASDSNESESNGG
ncbi:MAG: tetratricopeptide repeat protein [Pseudomonadota bacterium]